MELAPRWSARVAREGAPLNPLRVTTVRNRMAATIGRGITTDVYPRGRYLSGFCWAMARVIEHPETSQWSSREQKAFIKKLEEILALSSYRYQRERQPHDGLRGLTGKTNISDEELHRKASIDLDDFQLLRSNYAVETIQSNLRQFYLREGELGLTGAGRDLADAADEQLGALFEQLLEATDDGRIRTDRLDEIAGVYSVQALFENPACESERDALQKVVLGNLRWDHEDRTVTLDEWPARLTIPIEAHFEYETGDIGYPNDLRDAFESKVHVLRRAWCLFILRLYQLRAQSSGDWLNLDEIDQEVFDTFRDLCRVYWLQVYVAFALRAQLAAICIFLEQEAPQPVYREGFIRNLHDPEITRSVNEALSFSGELTDGELGDTELVRDLLLAGRASRRSYVVAPSTGEAGKFETVGGLRRCMDELAEAEWPPAVTETVTEPVLIRVIDDALDQLSDASSRSDAIGSLRTILGRSWLLLTLAASRYRVVVSGSDLLSEYVRTNFGTDPTSVPKMATYIEGFDGERSLTAAAIDVLDERVIDTHERVVRERLGSGNPITMAFDLDYETGAMRPVGGASRPGTQSLRMRRMRTLLRDVGLLTFVDDQYEVTTAGEQLLTRLRGDEG